MSAYRFSGNAFCNGPTLAYFLFIIVLLNQYLTRKTCRLQQDYLDVRVLQTTENKRKRGQGLDHLKMVENIPRKCPVLSTTVSEKRKKYTSTRSV